MRPGDAELAEKLIEALARYQDEFGSLASIEAPARRDSLVQQLIESDRRKRYRRYILTAEISPSRMDPTSPLFDPLKAAVLHLRNGSLDEAFWMVFLFVHFGRSNKGGWRYAAEVYGRRGSGERWDWPAVSADPLAFSEWISENAASIVSTGAGGFGNHRKYESLPATGIVVTSYLDWVGPTRQHATRFPIEEATPPNERRAAFAALFHSMRVIHRLGRVARFDYLSTVSHLEMASIEPDRAYLANATGPLVGAKLLFESSPRAPISPAQMEQQLAALDRHLRVGMDTLEDGLCNWQKSPDEFKPFRG